MKYVQIAFISLVVIFSMGVPCSGNDLPECGYWPSFVNNECLGNSFGPATTEVEINAALALRGKAVLCPGQVYELSNPVEFSADGQQICTRGLPENDADKAILRIVRQDLYTAITALEGQGYSDIYLQNVIVSAGIDSEGNPWPAVDASEPGGHALIRMGGATSSQYISKIVAQFARDFSNLHIREGSAPGDCSGVEISDSRIQNAGGEEAGFFVDGISYACHDGLIENNIIRDVTDGGIVLFGASGTVVRENHIYSCERRMLG